jgi:hypothetical protein
MALPFGGQPILDIVALNTVGAQPFSAFLVQGTTILSGNATAYTVLITDQSIVYTGSATGRTANLPAATGSGRVLELSTGPLTSPTNALTIQTAGTDVIGGGLAGAALILGSGDTNVTIQDTAAGKWTLVAREGLNVTSAKTGTAYVIAETDDIIPINSTATVTVTLPATPVIGERHQVVDTVDASMQTITIARNGNNINGAGANKTITTQFGTKTFTWLGGTFGWLETLAIP